MSCFICKPLNYQIEGRDTTASDLDFFRPINVNEMQANWDQATFRLIPFPSTGSSLFLLVDPSLFKLFFLLFKIVFRNWPQNRIIESSFRTDGFRIHIKKKILKGVQMTLNGEGVTNEDRDHPVKSVQCAIFEHVNNLPLSMNWR